MDPLLVGAGLVGLFQARKTALSKTLKNLDTHRQIEKLKYLRKDLERLENLMHTGGMSPKAVETYLKHLEPELPIKPVKKFSFLPFGRRIKDPKSVIEVNKNRIEAIIEDYKKNMGNAKLEALKQGILWGGAVYGVGYLARKLRDASKNNNPYKIDYPQYYEEMQY